MHDSEEHFRFLKHFQKMIDSAKTFLDRADQHLSAPQAVSPNADSEVSAVMETPPMYSALPMYSPLQRDYEAWTRPLGDNSMPEAFGTVPVNRGAGVSMWKAWTSYCGPGAMIAVGMDLNDMNSTYNLIASSILSS